MTNQPLILLEAPMPTNFEIELAIDPTVSTPRWAMASVAQKIFITKYYCCKMYIS